MSKLTSMGLPSKAVGNGGQGGTDRRGIEEPNRRPASVKASLYVLCPLLHVGGCLQQECFRKDSAAYLALGPANAALVRLGTVVG